MKSLRDLIEEEKRKETTPSQRTKVASKAVSLAPEDKTTGAKKKLRFVCKVESSNVILLGVWKIPDDNDHYIDGGSENDKSDVNDDGCGDDDHVLVVVMMVVVVTLMVFWQW